MKNKKHVSDTVVILISGAIMVALWLLTPGCMKDTTHTVTHKIDISTIEDLCENTSDYQECFDTIIGAIK